MGKGRNAYTSGHEAAALGSVIAEESRPPTKRSFNRPMSNHLKFVEATEWIIVACCEAGIELPQDSVEADWRRSVNEYLTASDFSDKSFVTVRSKICEYLKADLSSFEIDLFASGAQFEQIFGYRMWAHRNLLNALVVFHELELAEREKCLVSLSRNQLISLIKVRSIFVEVQSIRKYQAEIEEFRRHHRTASIGWAEPGFTGERPETKQQRFSDPYKNERLSKRM
jgi:hypothetical protein